MKSDLAIPQDTLPDSTVAYPCLQTNIHCKYLSMARYNTNNKSKGNINNHNFSSNNNYDYSYNYTIEDTTQYTSYSNAATGSGGPKASPLRQHHQLTAPYMDTYNNDRDTYPPQQPIGYQPGGPGGYDHMAGHYGYEMIDENDNAGLIHNQGRAGGASHGYNEGTMPRSSSKLDRAATMNRKARIEKNLY
ncbi:hypothetical protein BGZ94_002610 [Podila epigama]|nr:hypothetical protein BGZ94_002610 [Podila epigama]